MSILECFLVGKNSSFYKIQKFHVFSSQLRKRQKLEKLKLKMGKNVTSFATRICTEVLVLILTCQNLILWIFVLPPFLFLFLVYRLFVVEAAKYWHPELTHTLKSLSIFALENVTERPKSNIVCCFVFEGDISQRLEEIQFSFTNRVLDKKDNTGRLVYPELRQIWKSFLGYFFWKNETKFDIREHIRICDSEFQWNRNENENESEKSGAKFIMKKAYTEKDLKEAATQLLSQPWKRDFSLWEILILPNFYDNNNFNDSENEKGKSALIGRFHHSMGDGKGWANILLNDLLQGKDELPQMTQRKKPTCWQTLLLPLKAPYDFAKNTVEAHDTTNPSRNPWHTPQKRAKKYYTSITPPISVQRIKDLKNKFGVSYAAILITAVSGGIRRVMIEAGQNVPNDMKVSMVLPMPKHPGKICLHMTAINLCWPIGTENGVVRLDQIWRDMRAKQNSLYPFVVYFMIQYCHILPNLVKRMVYNKALGSIVASLFPGPTTLPTFLGHTAVDSVLLIGLQPGQLGASVSSSMIGGNQRIAVTIDKTLYGSEDKFEKLGGFIEQELRDLEIASAESFRSTELKYIV